MNGFVLIEVLLAAAISSTLSIALLSALYQTNRFERAVNNYTSMYGRIALIHDQMRRDIMGVFMPEQSKKIEKKIDDKEQEPVMQVLNPDDKEKKPLDKLFYSVNKGPVLDFFTFITNNPMQVYWGEKSGKPMPRVTRVVYRLVPEEKVKDSYSLLWQESDDLSFDSYALGKEKGIRAYEIIGGIKKCSMQFIAALEEKKSADTKGDAKEQEQTPKPQEFKTVKEWDDKKIQESDKRMPLMPQYVQVDIEMWDDTHKKTTPFSYTISLVPQKTQGQQNEPKKLETPAESEKDKNGSAGR
jgi:type II secretory pathway component PulJ